MKKKILALTLAVTMAAAGVGCGGAKTTATDSTTAKAAETTTAAAAGETKGEAAAESKEGNKEAPVSSGKTLIVGTMANSLGLPVHQADIAGYFKDAGLDVKIEIFATGAPINEAMAAGNLDVAVSGMASVYALATGMYTYIGDGVITTGGESIYARADSPIAKAAANDRGVIGDAEVLKGASILGPLATTAHYQAIKYMETFGLTTDDFSMVSMDYPQAYQAFVTGEGDLVANKMPYTNQLEEAGYVKVCDMNMVSDSPIIDTIFTQNKVMEERSGDLELFLDCYYRACEDLMKDEANRRKVAMEWYAEEGITYSESDMDTEISVKDYYTRETVASENQLGQFMIDIGSFYVDQDVISKDDFPKVGASINSSLIENVKARAGK
ncbi:ABC transporter substrate-binding protein [Clostridium sp. chh4-2]|uniref:ABC transporter substrate-binding protein n=1 Tax=Clostridium sp. chh4-2 TaxID=2067550 RepID=UPI000CCF2771|nr:ABC transporter substrate-binding protein [Clostridium sp. chh4-2]PNV61688.1 ABC transporter substrate-binding protein [Clostridium sp. chh4-2]